MDLNALVQFLIQKDEARVLTMSLSQKLNEDSWAWRLDNKGKFLVKTEHKFLNPEIEDRLGNNSWSKLW